MTLVGGEQVFGPSLPAEATVVIERPARERVASTLVLVRWTRL